MNRNPYFDYIEEKLHVLARRIETRGKLNLLDLHLHSENFYLHFFNLLYGFELQNLNTVKTNVEAIDLVDHTNKNVIQVSATCSKKKVESALSKGSLKDLSDYTFKFISIAKNASNLRKKSFINPYSINFIPSSDVYDIVSILSDVVVKSTSEIRKIYDFIKSELGTETDIVRLDTNLATVINILSKEVWDDTINLGAVNSFEIERKIEFNELKSSKPIIDEYVMYYGKVDQKYAEFDTQGANKSKVVLASINRVYREHQNDNSSDALFLKVVEEVKNKVLESSNYEQIPIDELELCIDILVVDAFVRCKIFENPVNYNYATT